MIAPCELAYEPPIHGDWWKKHVKYSKFRRQGIDITCASFEQSIAKANVVVVVGWSETFLSYSEIIKVLFERGFNVYTYDHQSQGLSGRWLMESQSTWVHTFDDYVDDFSYFVTSFPVLDLPVFVVAHSMGALIASIAMSRLPNLVNRAVLLAPMFRNKCSMKALHYRFPLPQPLAYWLTSFASSLGMGTMHSIGFLKEKSTDVLPLHVTTSDPEQLEQLMTLRQQYPNILSNCVTNDWTVHAINAQRKFSVRYEFVKTNTLIIAAERDRFVFNRAMVSFIQQAPSARMFIVPEARHELLHEKEFIRTGVHKVVCDFFSQKSNDVSEVALSSPLQIYDPNSPLYSLPELIIRASGIFAASVGIAVSLALIFGELKKK